MTASWVIREKSTGRVIAETFNKGLVDVLNTARYEAVPIGEYLGKVMGEKFIPAYAATDADKTSLHTIAANPAEAATRYGKETGQCSCCGRELTDLVSIEAGIGPICATKWGF